jgi:Zn-dependent protease with chaperone function
MTGWSRVLLRAKDHIKSPRLHLLIMKVLSSFPTDVPPLESVAEVRMRKRAVKGTVGLTVYGRVKPVSGAGPDSTERGTQTITFYSELLDELSDEAATGVIVHELAHAWLNEHVFPKSSKSREREADELARAWGYGRYLDALDAETEPY